MELRSAAQLIRACRTGVDNGDIKNGSALHPCTNFSPQDVPLGTAIASAGAITPQGHTPEVLIHAHSRTDSFSLMELNLSGVGEAQRSRLCHPTGNRDAELEGSAGSVGAFYD